MYGDVVVRRVQEAPVPLLGRGLRRYLELFLEHALQEGGVLPVAVVPHPRPRRLQHVEEVEVLGQARDAAVVAVVALPGIIV